jgi:DNA-binding NtrC family response regulator
LAGGFAGIQYHELIEEAVRDSQTNSVGAPLLNFFNRSRGSRFFEMGCPKTWEDIWNDYILAGKSVEEALRDLGLDVEGLQEQETKVALHDIINQVVQDSIHRHCGHLPSVAKELDVSLKSVYNMINRYDLKDFLKESRY